MSQRPPRVILASGSPARRQTLLNAGIDAEIEVSGADESAVTAPSVAELVATLAQVKAETVHRRLVPAGAQPPADQPMLIIGGDSLLEFHGAAFGKPGSAAAVIERWRQLRNDTGTLYTGHHLILDAEGQVRTRNAVAATIVHFADVDDAEIAAYAATGEPAQVAGGFTLDGLGGPLISGIEGDPHAVVGISLPLLRSELGVLGLPWPGFAGYRT